MRLFHYLRIGIIGFGGGTAIIPLIEELFVHRSMLVSPADMLDILSMSQMVPGALVANMVMFIGYKEAGIPGLFLALACSVLPGAIICLALGSSSSGAKLRVVRGLIGDMKPAILAMAISATLSIWGGNVTCLKSAVISVVGVAVCCFTNVYPLVVPIITTMLTLLLLNEP